MGTGDSKGERISDDLVLEEDGEKVDPNPKTKFFLLYLVRYIIYEYNITAT